MMNDVYGQLIHKSRYARYLAEKKRREHWPETVSRYFDFLEEHLLENNNYILSKKLRNELETAILNFEIMPSMRAMMTAGKALKRTHVAAYNCLSGDTTILTKEYGIVPISDLVDKNVSVLTLGGEWKTAPIRSFGEQPLMKVSMHYSTAKIDDIFATPDHDWLLTNGTKIKTKNLKKGMNIPIQFIKRKKTYDDIDYNLGIIHGLIYGDGTAQKYKKTPQDKIVCSQERIQGYHIRLCSDQKELLKYFDDYEKTYPKSYGGDPVIYLYNNFAKTHELKQLPKQNETESYLVGFFRGWLAADGYVSKDSQVSICGDGIEESWIKSVMSKYGVVVQRSSYLLEKTNFGKRKKKSKSIFLWRPSIMCEDFLISRKRDRFIPININEMKISDVQKTNRVEPVYCATVPNHQNFVLNYGVVTGNCSYLPIDDSKSFDEAMYILMCGSGVGFSVERQYINKLPEIPDELYISDTIIDVRDSKEGWAKALRQLIALLYSGEIPKWNTEKLRPAGAILKTFGGRSSGPQPLIDLFRFVVNTFKNAKGRKLNSLECHDIMCKIGEVVVVGGVRRSAMISLSNLSDDRMRNAKSGEWWHANEQRTLSNNSACYTEKPDVGLFMKEWISIYESKSGERGIFNREASQKLAQKFGKRDPFYDFGTNPCSEIILRPYGFCNLTEVVIRENDDWNEIIRKVGLATTLGTFQSTLTDFPYLRKIWKKNAEDERLLGVSFTGIFDNKLTYTINDELKANLETARLFAEKTNEKLAGQLGINKAAAITCVKPSGTVSQLVDSASGIHPRHDPYYIRRITQDNKDPLTQFLKDNGIPNEPKITPHGPSETTTIFAFPRKSPSSSISREQLTAIQHLDIWLTYQRYWCEHKPSVTINIKDDEWVDVGAWVYKHFDELSGIAFLPYDGGMYTQAPYETINEETYNKLISELPTSIDWDSLIEEQDNVEGVQTLACTAAGCEL